MECTPHSTIYWLVFTIMPVPFSVVFGANIRNWMEWERNSLVLQPFLCMIYGKYEEMFGWNLDNHELMIDFISVSFGFSYGCYQLSFSLFLSFYHSSSFIIFVQLLEIIIPARISFRLLKLIWTKSFVHLFGSMIWNSENGNSENKMEFSVEVNFLLFCLAFLLLSDGSHAKRTYNGYLTHLFIIVVVFHFHFISLDTIFYFLVFLLRFKILKFFVQFLDSMSIEIQWATLNGIVHAIA